jgi:hypothetical protein
MKRKWSKNMKWIEITKNRSGKTLSKTYRIELVIIEVRGWFRFKSFKSVKDQRVIAGKTWKNIHR